MPEQSPQPEGLAYPLNPSMRAEYLREQFDQQNLTDRDYYRDIIWAQTQQMDPRLRRKGIVATDSLRSALEFADQNPDLVTAAGNEERLDQSLVMLRRGYNPILLSENSAFGMARKYFNLQLGAHDLDPNVFSAVQSSIDILNVRGALNETLEELDILSADDIIKKGSALAGYAAAPQEKADAYVQDLMVRTDKRKTLGYQQLTEALPGLRAKRNALLVKSFGDRADEASMLIMAFVTLRTSQRSSKETNATIREPFIVALEDNDLDAMREEIYELALTNPNILTDATLNDLELGERQEWLDLIEADKLAEKESSKINKAAELYDSTVTDIDSAKQFYEDLFAGRTFIHTGKDGRVELIRAVEFVETAYPQATKMSEVNNYGFRTEVLNRKEGSKRPNSRYSLRNSIIRLMTEEWTEQPSEQ